MATDDVMGGGHLYTVKPVNVYDVTAAGKESLNAAQEMEMQRRQLNAQASQNAADRATQARQNALNRQAQQRENELQRAAEKEMAARNEKFMREQFERTNQQKQMEVQRESELEQAGIQKDVGLSAVDEDFDSEMRKIDDEEKRLRQEYSDAVATDDLNRQADITSRLQWLRQTKAWLSKTIAVTDTAHNLVNMGSRDNQIATIQEALKVSNDFVEVLAPNDIRVNSVLDALKQSRSMLDEDGLTPFGVERDLLMDPGVAVDILKDPGQPADTITTFTDIEKSGFNEIELRKRVRELYFQLSGQKDIPGLPLPYENPQGGSDGGLLKPEGMKLYEQALRQAEMELGAPGMKEFADLLGEMSVGDIKNQNGQADVEGTQRRLMSLLVTMQKASNTKGAESQAFRDDAAAQFSALVKSGLNAQVFGSVYQAMTTQLGTEKFDDSGRTVGQMTPSDVAAMIYMRNQKEMGLEIDPEALESIKSSQFTSPYHTLNVLYTLKDPSTGASMMDTIEPGLTYYKTKGGKVFAASQIEDVLLDTIGLISTQQSGLDSVGSLTQLADDILDADPNTAKDVAAKLNSLDPAFQKIVMDIVRRQQTSLKTLRDQGLKELAQMAPRMAPPVPRNYLDFQGNVTSLPGMSQNEMDNLLQAIDPSAMDVESRQEVQALLDFLTQQETSLSALEGGMSPAESLMKAEALKGLNVNLDQNLQNLGKQRRSAEAKKNAERRKVLNEFMQERKRINASRSQP